jgi:hypothetical protein
VKHCGRLPREPIRHWRRLTQDLITGRRSAHGPSRFQTFSVSTASDLVLGVTVFIVDVDPMACFVRPFPSASSFAKRYVLKQSERGDKRSRVVRRKMPNKCR